MSILGNRVPRIEDPALLTIGGTYTADLDDPRLGGAAHVRFVRSPMAHARIESVETSDAAALDGVVAVYTAADVEALGGVAPVPHMPPLFPAEMARSWLASGTVRYAGEPIAVVLADDPAVAEDAAAHVWADLDPLEPLLDLRESARDERLLFPEAGTNVAFAAGGDLDPHLLDAREVVVRETITHQRLAACPLEGRSVATVWEEGNLTCWLSNQNVHGVRDLLASIYGLEAEQVRVITPDVGGGFGPKIYPHAEELFLPWLARQAGRPVRWTEDRTENMISMGHGRGQLHDVAIGGRRDGTVEVLQIDILADAGAYPALGSFLPHFTRRMASGTYAIGKVESRARSVVTNTMSTVAYRGAGRPEATATVERAIDLFAREVGMDPAEVRKRNLVAPEAFPYESATGATYDTGDYPRALELVLEQAGYQELRDEQRRRREAGDVLQMGIGLSTYVEITAGPSAGREFAEVRVTDDGRATVYTGSSAHGQGHHTSWAMIASEELGLPIDAITVVHGDTAVVARGAGTMGSRSLQLGGAAVQAASVELVHRARELAGELLEADPADVVLDHAEGRFHVAGSPAVARTWGEVAAAAGGTLAVQQDFQASTPTFPFGAHLAVVEIDTDTGRVELLRFVACDDAGRILNPLIAEGQRHGGIAQGVAQALQEEFSYDRDGNPLTATLADYAMISATDLPSFDLIPMETPTPANPLGAKGIGESGTIGSTPAVVNAVVDALAPWGVRHIEMPCTPERVWRAMRQAGGNQ